MDENIKNSIVIVGGIKSLIVKAKIINLNTEIKITSAGRKYMWVKIKAYMPDGTTQKGSTKIWEEYYSYKKYKKDDMIDIAVDLEGNYIGHSQIYKKEEEITFESEILKIHNKIYVNSENIEFVKAKVKVIDSKLKSYIKNVFIWKELNESMDYEKDDIIFSKLLLSGPYKGLSHIYLGKSIRDKWVNYNFDFFEVNPKKIKKITIGIPQNISKKIRWVLDEYRTNELSIIPGGFDIVIEYYSGDIFGYDKVKEPNAYIKRVILKEINHPYNEFNNLEKNNLIKLIKEKINRIYYRNQHNSLVFNELWNSSKNKTPWK